jgi:hypothetical protein
MKFLSHNLEIYALDFRVYGINLRNKLQLHRLTANHMLYQKGEWCIVVKIFSELPEYFAKLVVG